MSNLMTDVLKIFFSTHPRIVSITWNGVNELKLDIKSDYMVDPLDITLNKDIELLRVALRKLYDGIPLYYSLN